MTAGWEWVLRSYNVCVHGNRKKEHFTYGKNVAQSISKFFLQQLRTSFDRSWFCRNVTQQQGLILQRCIAVSSLSQQFNINNHVFTGKWLIKSWRYIAITELKEHKLTGSLRHALAPLSPLCNTAPSDLSHITPLSPAGAVTAGAPPACAMFFKFMCAVVTRSFLILISLIGVWRVVWVKDNGLYWFLTILYLPLVVEMILTLRRRKGKDYKWYEWLYFNSLPQHKYHCYVCLPGLL